MSKAKTPDEKLLGCIDREISYLRDLQESGLGKDSSRRLREWEEYRDSFLSRHATIVYATYRYRFAEQFIREHGLEEEYKKVFESSREETYVIPGVDTKGGNGK